MFENREPVTSRESKIENDQIRCSLDPMAIAETASMANAVL